MFFVLQQGGEVQILEKLNILSCQIFLFLMDIASVSKIDNPFNLAIVEIFGSRVMKP